MKRLLLHFIVFCFLFAACGSNDDLLMGQETDYPAAIMVEGKIYLLNAEPIPGEIDESAIVGYTSSYTDTFPEKDGETNFDRELNLPYAKIRDSIVILYEHEWHWCTPKE